MKRILTIGLSTMLLVMSILSGCKLESDVTTNNLDNQSESNANMDNENNQGDSDEDMNLVETTPVELMYEVVNYSGPADNIWQGQLVLSTLESRKAGFTLSDDALSDSELMLKLYNDESLEERTVKAGASEEIFDNLEPDTYYTLELYYEEVLSRSFSFKTFAGIEEVELFYVIDTTGPIDGQIGITIFGSRNGQQFLPFSKPIAHLFTLDSVRIVDGTLTVNQVDEYEFDAETLDLICHFNTESGFFSISYISDKSFKALEVDGGGYEICYGIFKEDMLLATGENLLLYLENYDLEGTHVSMMVPYGWYSEVGFESTAFEHLYVNVNKEYHLPSTNMYAFDPSRFNFVEEKFYDTDFTAILDKELDDVYLNHIPMLFEDLCDLWGGSVPGKYTIVIIDDDQYISVGEYSRGQAMSNVDAYGIRGNVVHQYFHVWNGWVNSIPFNSDDGTTTGFWVEGFDEYYVNMYDFQFDEAFAYDCLRAGYEAYNQRLASERREPIIFRQDDTVYNDGKVLAYALNQEIMNQTDGQYTLDDLMKYAWQQWRDAGEAMSYDVMIRYLNDILPEGIDDWWQRYILDQEPLYFEELEG